MELPRERDEVVMRRASMRCRQHQRVLMWGTGYLLAIMSVGCQTPASGRWLAFVSGPTSEHGQTQQTTAPPAMQTAVEPAHSSAEQPSPSLASISAKGWVSESRGSAASTIVIEMTSHGTIPFLLSYISDEYVGTTRDERSISLEKEDFLNYPEALNPGDTRTVTLRLPRDLSIDELASITARLNIPRAVVTLFPVEARVLAESETTIPIIPPSAAMRPVPPASEARQFMTALLKPMRGSVPVTVEFLQELGTTLTAQVWWKETGDPIRLADGTRQMFEVVPGRHVLCVESELPFIAHTRGQVPMIVNPGTPVRITITARAHLDGVELSVRVWQGETLIAEQVMQPPPTTHAG